MGIAYIDVQSEIHRAFITWYEQNYEGKTVATEYNGEQIIGIYDSNANLISCETIDECVKYYISGHYYLEFLEAYPHAEELLNDRWYS